MDNRRDMFCSVVWHETREVTTTCFNESDEFKIIIQKRGRDKEEETFKTLESMMCVPHDDFINITHLNWSRIFFHLFAKSDVAPEDLIPVETIEDNGILQDCRCLSGILYKRIGKFQSFYPLIWQSYSVEYCLWQNCSLEKSSAFLVTVSLYNADCHWKKHLCGIQILQFQWGIKQVL